MGMIRDHSVIIQKNGKLWFCSYNSKSERGYQLTDISNNYRKHLFKSIVIGPEVTVKDFLILARRDLKFWKEICENDLTFLEKPFKKFKLRQTQTVDDVIDYVSISNYLELQEKVLDDPMESTISNPDITGKIIGDQENYGIDWQWFNIYLDTPVQYGNSMGYFHSDKKEKEFDAGIIYHNFIDVMKMFLELNYSTRSQKDHEVEYIFNWDEDK